MTDRLVPISTAAGNITGRDAIFLDGLYFPDLHNVEFTGSLNANLCDGLDLVDHFVEYVLKFTGIVLFRYIELDFDGIYLGNGEPNYDDENASSFDHVENSSFLHALREADHSSKISDAHNHYILSTYDEIFEIVATGWELTLGASHAASND